MEKNLFRDVYYASPYWKVLLYVVEHPGEPIRGSLLTKALPDISKSAIYNALRLLKEIDILTRESPDEDYTLNPHSVGLQSLMRFYFETLFRPLVSNLSDAASKIILFGSRVNGDYSAESDFDLLVVSSDPNHVRRVVERSELSHKIQLIVKTPEEWIDLHETNPELYRSVQKGSVLWERNSRSASKRRNLGFRRKSGNS